VLRCLHQYWRFARVPLAFSAALSVFAATRYFDSASSRRADLTPLVIVVGIYFGLGALAGLVVMLFGRWASSRVRAAFLGFASGTLVAVAVNFSVMPLFVGEALLGRQLLFVMVITGLFPGAFLGALFWEPRPTDLELTRSRGHRGGQCQ